MVAEENRVENSYLATTAVSIYISIENETFPVLEWYPANTIIIMSDNIASNARIDQTVT